MASASKRARSIPNSNLIPPLEEITIGRSRPTGRVRETRGKKKGKGAAAQRVAAVDNTTYKSYDDPDTGNQLPAFVLCRPPGLHLNVPVIRGILMRQICLHTNSYGWMKIVDKPYHRNNAGAWKETSAKEIALLIAIILYFGLVWSGQS